MKGKALCLSLLLTTSTSFAGTDCVEGSSISYREIQDLTTDLTKCSMPVLVASETVVLTLLRTWQSEEANSVGLRSLPVLVAIAGAKADLALIRMEMGNRRQKIDLKSLVPKTDSPPEEPK
jgi:hypothetical protein